MIPMTKTICTIDLTSTLMFREMWLDIWVVSVFSLEESSPVLVLS